MKNTFENELLNFIAENTLGFLKNLDTQVLITDALTLSLEFKMDRSNMSRILNRLHRNNQLIKLQGRPTLFLSRDILVNKYPDSHFSSNISSLDNLMKGLKKAERQDTQATHEALNFSGVIGSNQNETLYEAIERARVFSNYPDNRYNILIVGESYTGKGGIINLLHKNGVFKGKLSNTMLMFECTPMKDNSSELLAFLKEMELAQDGDKAILVVFKELNLLDSDTQLSLFKSLNTIQSNRNSFKKQYVFIETAMTHERINNYNMIIAEAITVPSINDRTLKERVELVLDRFQYECDLIGRSIYINKNILSCFITAKYQNNMLGLENQIKYSISNCIFRNKDSQNSLLNLNFDDLSDFLLNSISDVSNQLVSFNTIMSFLGESGFYFLPNIPLQASISLNNAYMDSSDSIISNTIALIPLSKYIKKEIEASFSDEINTIRSLNISEIYDCIYPILESEFGSHDQLFLKLFSHLEARIEQIKHDRFKQVYYNDVDYVRPEIVALAQKITSAINNQFKITLPKIEISYLQSYLVNAMAHMNKGSIPLLLISHSYDISVAYAEYLKTLSFKTQIEIFSYSEPSTHQSNMIIKNQINERIDEINQGRGVVVVTDIDTVASTLQEQFKMNPSSGICISPMNLQTLIGICSLSEKSITRIQDFERFSQQFFFIQNSTQNDEEALFSSKLLHDISTRLLSESLVFLDVRKAISLLTSVLLNIYQKSHMSYSDELSIRFLHHCSFMIERNIRNEPLQTKNTNSIIKQNFDLYQTIEKEFRIINNHFGIQIPSSELAMIVEIFNVV